MRSVQQIVGLGLISFSLPFFLFALSVWIGGLVPSANPLRLFQGTAFWAALQDVGTFRQVLVALIPGALLWAGGFALIRRAE